MATKFPLQINNLRFFVNPTALTVTKTLVYGQLPTQNGVQFQAWYDSPETLTIAGASAGTTAYRELVFLKKNYENTNRVCELFYKTRIYRGFITELTVDHAVEHINQFNYSINFTLLQGERFAFEDFALKSNDSGFVSTQLRKLESIVNEPLNRLDTGLQKILSKI